MAVYNGEADAAFTFKDARTLFEGEDFYDDLMENVVFVLNTSEIPNDVITSYSIHYTKLYDIMPKMFLFPANPP